MKTQRLRFRYRLGPEALELRHRDLVNVWQDAAAAAGIAVSQSEGKRPAPQISLVAPLPQGVTSECEIVDVYVESRIEPSEALAAVAKHMPPGIVPYAAEELGVNAPSVQAILRWAEYEADVPSDGQAEDDLRAKIDCLLSKTELPAEYKRETKTRAYDLRPLILDLRLVESTPDSFRLAMTLRAEQENTGRADQVILALGLPEATRIHRKRLGLVTVPAVIAAYRRTGERED